MRSLYLPLWLTTLFLFFATPPLALAQESGFTQEDRERLVRMETTLQVFMDQTNRRFEDMNKRFEDMNKRFEEMRIDNNKRADELRADMNFRFEQMDRRFEQVDKRFEQLMSFLWILVGVFTAITVAAIGFAYWDRRSYIRQAREESIRIIEKEGRLTHLIQALRETAPNHPDLASALRKYGLM